MGRALRNTACTKTRVVSNILVLGPLMFLIYINDIGEHITSNLRLFADDSLLYCAIDIPQDCLALQEDLDKLS